MGKYILVTFLIIFNMSVLNAKELIKVESLCLDTKEFIIKLQSTQLDLSEDALIDNTGGYVDIPAEKNYIKTKDKLYYLKGFVENKNGKKEFRSNITQNMESFITLKEVYGLKDIKKMRFIQKIDLEKNNKEGEVKNNITTSNIVNIYFDKELLEKEYKRCK